MADGDPCDDSKACTTGDTCQGGECVADTVDCSSLGDFCNTGVCSEAAGGCTTTPVANGTPCDDSLYCTIDDACQDGVCAGTARDCSDLDGACVVGACRESPSECYAAPVADDTGCDDGKFCTTGDRCVDGVCEPTGVRDCADTDLCTIDSCDLGTDQCVHPPRGPIPGAEGPPGDPTCTDGIDNDCDGFTDSGDASCNGCILDGDCADGNPCTDDICTLGVCSNPLVNNGTACTTGHYCKVNGQCQNGQCVESDRDCADSNPCTTDTCDDSGSQCVHTGGRIIDAASPVSTSSRDGTPLTACVVQNSGGRVLALPLLHRPAIPTTTYVNGTGTASITGCSDIDVAMVLPKMTLDFFSAFDSSKLLMKNKSWDPQNSNIDPTPVPSNLWLPQQGVGPFCLGGTLAQSPWVLDLKNTAATGQNENIEMVLASAPYQDVQTALESGSMVDVLAILTFRHAGWVLNENVPRGTPSGVNINANDDYPNNYTVTYSGRPTDTDVIGITIGDYSGQNGTGPLFLLGTAVHKWDVLGSIVNIPNSDLNASGAPAGVRRLASVTTAYLNPDAHTANPIPANRQKGISTVLVRQASGGGAPFGSMGGTGTVSNFLNIAGTTFTAPTTFTWENATANGNAPRYSVHELVVRSHRYLPVLTACTTENDVRKEYSTQWIVVRPFGATCAGSECFTLPTLPASFPRQTAGTQKKSGFEQLIGSGTACSGSCAVGGEACVDPDGAGSAAAMCMGGAGTGADPYYTQEYMWWPHLYRVDLLSSFNFQSYAFGDRVLYMSHESSNEQVFQ